MSSRISILFAFTLFLGLSNCKEIKNPNTNKEANQTAAIEQEKQSILKTLNDETKAAFQRDYDAWQEKWVHHPNITKIYLDFSDSTFSESVGWENIGQFVKTFMAQNPEPEPVPELLNAIDVRFYGNGAWVTYEQQDSLRGLKRETRLMEKIDGKWKIAGMQTTIYGFDFDDAH